MTHELRPIDISANPELLRLAEEVRTSREPRVLRRDSEDIAVLMPVTAPPPKLARRRAKKLVADAAIPPATTYTLEEMAGAVPALPAGQDWRQVERAVKEERAARFRHKLQHP